MLYTNFNEKEISKITLGTVQLGLPYGIANKTGKPSIKLAHEILKSAIKGGINLFDTAINYGESEQIIGNYIKANPSQKMSITSKIPKIPDDLDSYEAIKEFFYENISNSLKNLHVEKLTFCLLHSAPDLKNKGDYIVRIFNELKDENKIESFGVSIYTVEEVEEFLKFDDMTAIQIPFNLFDQKLKTLGYLTQLNEKQCLS